MRLTAVVRACLLVGVLFAASPEAVRAQEQQEQTSWMADVLGIAGSDFYLSIGAEDGLAPGAELELRAAGRDETLGRVRVRQVSSGRSIVSFVGGAFPVTRGTRVTARLVSPRPGVAPPTPPVRPAPSIPAANGVASGVEAHGTVGLSFAAGRTTTEWEEAGVDPTNRSFTTPESWLNLRVRGLPAGFRLRVDARAAYRGSSDDRIQPAGLLRVSGAQLTNSFGPFDVGFGRTYNPYDNSTGYFDGLYVRGGRAVGLGLAAGFEPERTNAGVTTEVPKGSVFLDASVRSRDVSYVGVASATFIRPTDRAGRVDRTFLSLRQTLRVGRVRAGQSLQVDRDPAAHWSVSRLVLDASAELGGGVGLRGFYSRRRPVDDDPADEFQPFSRDQATVGLTLTRGGFQLRLDGGRHTTSDGASNGPMFTGSGSYVASSGLGLDLSGGYWEGNGVSTTSLRPGLRHPFGETRVRAWYAFYRSADPLAAWQTHTVGASVSTPLGRSLRLDLAGRAQLGETLRGTWVTASIGWMF